MAAPKEKSLKDLSGEWMMNRDVSDDVDGVLQIQGFNKLMRAAIAKAPVYLHISQSEDGGHMKFLIDQKTTAKIPALNEEWITDWEMKDSKDPVMGKTKAKARWSDPSGVEDADYLAGGWLDEGSEQIEAYVESVESGWTAYQIWGFENIQDKRMFVRRVVVKKGDEVAKVRTVYDYQEG